MAVISNQNLLSTLAKVCNLSGDVAEIGVLAGETFKRLALTAHAIGKKAHAFDSFQGMAKPTKNDLGEYPEGVLSVGGVDAFTAIMDAAEIPRTYYELHPGWIPTCFDGFKNELSFALIDVDQYQPTVTALDFIWERMQENGILLLDDYFDHVNGLASLAIKEWMKKAKKFNILDHIDTQLYVQKMPV